MSEHLRVQNFCKKPNNFNSNNRVKKEGLMLKRNDEQAGGRLKDDLNERVATNTELEHSSSKLLNGTMVFGSLCCNRKKNPFPLSGVWSQSPVKKSSNR